MEFDSLDFLFGDASPQPTRPVDMSVSAADSGLDGLDMLLELNDDHLVRRNVQYNNINNKVDLVFSRPLACKGNDRTGDGTYAISPRTPPGHIFKA